MSNQVIIEQFEKLIKYIQYQLNQITSIKEKTSNNFRLKQLKNILAILKKYQYEIKLDNLKDFGELPGIGKGTLDRIKEILKTGKLKELDNFSEEINENNFIIEDLKSVVGIGTETANKMIKDGIISVQDLKTKVLNDEYEVNDKIKLGLKYYGVFEGNIPRKEIDKVYKLLESVIKKMNKKFNEKYIFEICGSYRRELPISGDIDILISNLDTNTINHLEKIVKILKEPIKTNNNNPLLVDDITDKKYITKYMGFSKYKNNPIRRIDIRYVSYDVYYSALLYFTGSAELNINMRRIAEKMGLKLSEYGLTKDDGTKIQIKSEYDIFKILKLEYLAPRLR